MKISMWAYIAGLFDGDGNFFIMYKRSKKSASIGVGLQISSSTPKNLKPMISFLKENGIYMGIYGVSEEQKAKDDWRTHGTYILSVQKQKSVKKLCLSMYPHLLLKKDTCDIILDIIRLKEEIKQDKKRKIVDNLHIFDVYRYKLHSYSRKGIRTLKPWIY